MSDKKENWNWIKSQEQHITHIVRLFIRRNNATHIEMDIDRFGYAAMKGATEQEVAEISGMIQLFEILSDQGPFDDPDQIQIKRLVYGNLVAADTDKLGRYEEEAL